MAVQKCFEVPLKLRHGVACSGNLDEGQKDRVDTVEDLVQFRIHRLGPSVHLFVLFELSMRSGELAAQSCVCAGDRVDNPIDVHYPFPRTLLRQLETANRSAWHSDLDQFTPTALPAPPDAVHDAPGSTKQTRRLLGL